MTNPEGANPEAANPEGANPGGATPQAQFAVIGGSGFYALEELGTVESWRPETPYGSPSDAIVIGSVGAKRVAFLPRHGVGHVLLPHEIPGRANI